MMVKRHSQLLIAALSRGTLLLLLSFCISKSTVSAQIWSENFNSYPNATTQGPPKWSTTATDCDDAGNQLNLGPGISQWGVWSGQFAINDIEGAPCCPLFGGGGNDNSWLSQVIDIEDFCNISISADVQATGVFECDNGGAPIFGCMGGTPPDNSHDQVVFEYSINGGGWTQFGYVCGDAGVGTVSTSGLNGNTLQIRFFAANKSNAEFYYIDNILVTGTTATVPPFAPIGPLCENDGVVTLPTTSSSGGINGTWSPPSIDPTGLGGTTNLFTFTPNPGQCATTTTMNISVLTAVTPVPPNLGPFCETAAPVALANPLSGVAGTWSGNGVTGNSFDPGAASPGNNTLTFTPNANLCANAVTTDVVVNNAVTPDLDTESLCSDAPDLDLNSLEDPIYPNGTWSGPGVTGNNFDPSGQNGNVVLTFTSSDACVLPATTTITVTPLVVVVLSGVPPSICENEPSIALPTPQGGVTGNWSGQGVSSNNFDPSGLNGNISLTFTPTPGQCAAPASTIIDVDPAVTPAITGIPASICELASSINLPTTQGGIAGTWSGTGVSGNQFDPTGLSGNVTLTFTPNSGLCANPANTSINVNPAVTPAITGVPASICELAANINLPTNQGGIAGTWSGPGVSGNQFDPTGLSGNVILTFTPNSGLCANPATTSINVDPAVTPAITGVPANICETAANVILSTTQDGITGTWSGPGVSGNQFDPSSQSGTVTLTFTPNSGQCANPNTAAIDVEPSVAPNVTGVPASICEMDASIALPTTLSGVNGNWSGLGVSGNNFDPSGLSGNITLTFTPSIGQCATNATTIINVSPAITPVVSGIPASICELAPSINLPTTLSGITGDWSGQGVSGNQFDPTGLSGTISLTFTPDAGQCANNASANINVNPAVTPNITGIPASICETAPNLVLATNQGGIAGSWSGPGVSGNQFDPSGQSGTVTLTFTPNAGLCAVAATADILVTPNIVPDLSSVPASICETAANVILPINVDGINGNWTGQGVSGNQFDPSGQNGSVVLTFTPFPGQCATDASTTIDVGTGIAPDITGLPANICQTDPVFSLPTIQSGIVGNWSGQGVLNNDFDPTGLNGNITLTFTPDAVFCAGNATAIITVNPNQNYTINGVPPSICELAAAITLPTSPGGVSGTWSGQGVIGDEFNPIGLGGIIPLTFTPDASFCANETTININVTPDLTPTISGVPPSICQSAAAINLPTTQGGVIGTWSGQGVTGNQFNPAGLSGNITLTFTPNATFCASTVTTVISVVNNLTPTITGVPASICETAAAIALPTTQSGVAGNWSGPGVSSNSFDPNNLSGNVTLTFTPTNSLCANNATTVIAVNQSATPVLGTATLCQTAGLFAISSLNDLNFPAGAWSGPGVSGSNFDPSGQSGIVTLTFSPSANCVNQASTTVTVNAPVAPTLGTASLCQNEAAIDLATLANLSFPSGAWSGPGVVGGNFNPAGQSGSVTLTFTPTANCTVASTTIVTVNGAPSFTGLMEPCEPTNTTYTVVFNLSGGTAPYTVDGNVVVGSTFTSTSILSGGNYMFTIDDANGCGPVTASGTENCDCVTDAGTMNTDNAPLSICYSFQQFSAPFNNDETLDGNDALQFVLHDNPGGILGNIFGISNSAVIPIPAGLTLGQTYYVSAIAGNDTGGGTVDLLDGCLSVSQGVPVVFYLPSVNLGNDATICAADCYQIPLQFTGVAPFLFDYSVLVNGIPVFNSNVDNLNSGDVVEFCPASFGITNATVEFVLQNLSDANLCELEFPQDGPAPSVTITVGNSVVDNISPTLCPGGSIVVNGTVYNEANPTGTEVFPGGSFSGCDSVANVNLAFYLPVSSTFTQSFCGANGSVTINGTVYDASNPTGTEIFQNATTNGCDSTVYVNLTFGQGVVVNFTQTLCPGGSVTVNGTVYDQSNPSGTEVIIGGSTNGCDSTVIINLSFNSVVTENISQTLCPGGSITVNGTVYDAANPSGSELFVGGSYLNCDSLVVINLNFFPPAQSTISQLLCADDSIVVNGNTYDINNPSGTEIIAGGSVNNCDSTIFVNLSFAPIAEGFVNLTICPEDSITVGTTVFNADNPSGIVVLPNASYLNCDSTVFVALGFYPTASSTLDDQYCIGTSIFVNGTEYNEANPTGVEVFQNITINGCDSTVYINMTFGSSVIVDYNETLCHGEVIFINGTLYSESNPSGTETFPGGSYLGCDSVVNVNLSFYQEALGNITEILQSGGSIVVNGTVYNEQNPSGIEVFQGASFFGCDSTVIINLSFEGEPIVATIQSNSPLCHFGDDGSIVLENIVGGTPPYIVALNGSNSAPVVTFPVIFDGLTFGFHTLTIVDALGVVTSEEVFLPDAPEISLDLGGILNVPLGNSVTLSAEASVPISSWTWSPPDYLECTDCPNPLCTPLNDITYTLAVTDANGCTADGEVTVIVEKVQEVYIPNAFSPNNDGLNDELTVFAGPQVELVRGFQIFSRWGELIFEQYTFPPNDLQIGWDGTFKGKQLDPAVFVWVAEILFIDGQVKLYKGDVTLVK